MQLGRADRFGTSENIKTNRKSIFGRFDFQLQNKYVFTVTARADESSRFQGKNALGIFPALAVAWKIDEEDFMQNVNFIDQLKLRITYGETGNDRIQDGVTAYLLGTTTNRGPGFNNVDNIYYQPDSGSLYNPEIIWETTTTSNFGLDFTMFNKRLNGSIDYYQNETRDLLYKKNISLNSGFQTEWANIGSTAMKVLNLD